MTRSTMLALWVCAAATAPQAALAQLPARGAATLGSELQAARAYVDEREIRKARLDSEVAALGERRAAAHGRLRLRTRALYRLTRAGMLPLAGGFSALLGHVGRIERLRRMVRSDARAVEGFARRHAALDAEATELASQIEQSRQTVRALEIRRRALQDEARLAALQGSVVGGYDPYRESYRFAGDGVGYGSLQVVGGADAARFADARGRLAMPVAGARDIREGQREDARGLEFLAPPGTPVRAVAAGRVVYSDRYGAYERMVIVDHGDSYFTVYGGVGQVEARIGDPVTRGGRLATVGLEGRSRGLFFEVRRGTRTLDAPSWLGL